MKLTHNQMLKEYFSDKETIVTQAKELQGLFISINEEMRQKDIEIKKLKEEKTILNNLCKSYERRIKMLENDAILNPRYVLDLSA